MLTAKFIIIAYIGLMSSRIFLKSAQYVLRLAKVCSWPCVSHFELVFLNNLSGTATSSLNMAFSELEVVVFDIL